jgi:hypothetical protein
MGPDIARHLLDGSIGGPGIEDSAAAGTTEYTHGGVAVASTIAHIAPCRKSVRSGELDMGLVLIAQTLRSLDEIVTLPADLGNWS